MPRRRYAFASDVGSARPAPDLDAPVCMACSKRRPKIGPFCGRPCAVAWALAMTESHWWCARCIEWREARPCQACAAGGHDSAEPE